jgi:YesN/AraC family two-component response regulator
MTARSILLVEDDMATRELLSSIITMKYPDNVLHSAINGRTGLELFNEHLLDIVITDINMPEMGGVHMAGKIKAIKPDTKIIVLTANTGKINLDQAEGEGFEIDHYILKPVDFKMLFAALDQCLGEFAQRV